MVNVIPPNHVDEVPVIEPNQHDDVPVVPEPVLVEEDEDPEEYKFEEEEDPQEEDDDMEIDIEEDENEPKLTYPYEEVDPLNPSPPASESKPKDEIKVENLIEHEDETVSASVHEKKGKAKDKFYGKLILELDNEVRSSVEQGTVTMEKLVEKLGNTEDKVECKKLKKEFKEARFSNTFLRMQNERNHASKVCTMTQAAILRMIKDSVDAAITAERARQENVRNDDSRSGPVRGHDAIPAVCECTFVGFMMCNHAVFRGVEGAFKLQRWFEKTESVFEISKCAKGKKVKFVAATLEGLALTWWKTKVKEYDVVAYTQRFNELDLMCPRMVEPERVKVDAYIWGLTDNIKGEVTSSTPADLNEAVCMAHKLMEQKSQARDARILEGNKQKWESLQGGNSSGKGNQRDNSRHTLQNSQKKGNAQCMIKCHKCGKVGHKERYRKEKNVATGANAQPIWTCYEFGEQGHTRNRCPKKVKQEEVGEARGRAYAIKDVEPQGASYEVELVDERVASMNTVLKGCTLNLVNHIFEIDLMLIEFGMFDVIITMDWLVKHDAVIVCGEKVVRISYRNEMLIVESDKGVSRLKSKSKEKRMEDVPVICNFPKEFPGLPPPRQVEF
uniref:CCHC-type domain-containing protein n=1 Tax=Tanacetum cinerariifolium TaxID=118510 RepID=A0A699GWF0_TANCI|nr:hypothetical protein [Tanacetum cinerariifolium]